MRGCLRAVAMFLGVTMVAFLTFVCCFQGYRIELPNGYSLVRTDYGVTYIMDGLEWGARIVTEGNIERYAVEGNFVVGYIALASGNSEAEQCNEGAREGYFVLDTRDESLFDGLTEEEWRDRLQRAGFDWLPEIRVPSRWD